MEAVPRSPDPKDPARNVLGRIAEQAGHLIAAVDMELRFTAFNRAFRDDVRRRFGTELEVGASLADAVGHLPGEHARLRQLWERALGGEAFETTTTLGDPDRGRGRYRIAFQPLPEGGEAGPGAFQIGQDVSDQEEDAGAAFDHERLRAVLEILPVGVWIADDSGRFLVRNQAAREIWGETAPMSEAPESYGRDYRAWWPDGRSVTSDEWALARALRDGEISVGEELEIETADGQRKTILNSALPLRDRNGVIVGGVAVNVDITARREAEEELRRSRALAGRQLAEIEAIYDAAPTGLCVLDRDLRFRRVNRRLAELNDMAPEDHIGRSVEEVVPGLADQVVRHLRRVLDTGEPILDIEVPEDPSRPPGHVRFRRGSYHPLRVGPRGDVIGVNVTVEDITERKRAELARNFLADASTTLSSSLDYQKTLARIAHLAIPVLADYCIVDVLGEDGRIERAAVAHIDPELQELLDGIREFPPDLDSDGCVARVLRTGEAEIGADASALDVEAPSDRREEVAELIQSLGPRSHICIPLAAGGRTLGSLLLVSSRADRAYDDWDLEVATELGRRAGTAMDNARLHAAEQAARARAEEASRVKSRFLATMSHELRTPLSGIIGYTDLLESGVVGDLTEAQREQLKRVKTSAWHLVTIIDEILTFSRVEAGREQVREETVELVELVRESAAILQPEAEAKDLALELRLPEAPVRLVTDPAKVKQILLNLIGNAVKFTDDGAVRIAIHEDDGVEIRVEDSGPGIPADLHQAVFEPFTQVDDSHTRSKGGTGLGLAVSRRLAVLLGGELTVESAVGVGSTFTLRLPAAPPRPEGD